MYQENKTQEEIILNELRKAKGWLSGMYFLRLAKPITQYHARIFGLQKKGHIIEGRFKFGRNYKEYRIIES